MKSKRDSTQVRVTSGMENSDRTQRLAEIHYPDRVRWQCVRCHACCGDTDRHSRHIRLLEAEATTISQLTGLDPKSFCTPLEGFEPYKFEIIKKASGNCFFLKEDSCLIYEERPLTCRFYPFFLEELSTDSFKFGLTNEKCPGLGRGPALNSEFFNELLRTASKKIRRK